MIRALFFLGVVLLVSSLVWMAVGGRSVPKKTWVEFVDSENPSFDPGQVQLRVQTFDIPPVFRTCATRTASGGYTVNLNSKGNGYFCSHAVDVNAAIEEALLEAETALLEMGSEDWCDNQCASVSGSGGAIVNGASATVSVSIGNYEAGDPKCDPENAGAGTSGISITATAPRTPGVDLEPLLDMVNLDSIPGLPTTYRNAADKFLADVRESGCLVDVPSFDEGLGVASISVTLPGYDNAGLLYVGYNEMYVTLMINVPANVPGIGNEYQLELTAQLEKFSGTWASGGTVTGSGYFSSIDPTAAWGSSGVSSPGLFPTSAVFSNDTTPPPREINEIIPLTNNPDAEVWIPEPTFNDSPTTRLFADDAITIAYSYYQIQLSPGIYEQKENLFYRNIKPFPPLCMELQEMHHVALPETEFNPDKSPPCIRRILPRPDLILA